jgi:cellobiose-specific phosphotransferase system component IIA
MEVAHARAGAIETHKRKLDARKSLAKGGSITASDALQRVKDKRRKEADDNVQKAKTAITRTENKARNMLKERGIQARKDERARLLLIQQH